MLSPDGALQGVRRARQTAIVRGEGAGVGGAQAALSDAIADGDRIYAVIRGDGGQPGRPQQRPDGAEPGRRRRRCCATPIADAGVAPGEVDYVEAHGTGTPLGDPIEAAGARRRAWHGARARERPLVIGSVKTNIGHLEAAAGIAGLIKAALSLSHGRSRRACIPAPNPHIPWEELPSVVPGRHGRLPNDPRRRIARVAPSVSAGRMPTWSWPVRPEPRRPRRVRPSAPPTSCACRRRRTKR